MIATRWFRAYREESNESRVTILMVMILAICSEPVDIGSCTSGSSKRFYFDEEYQTCRAFIYTGCGGNRNRFKTFESCINTCLRSKFRTRDHIKELFYSLRICIFTQIRFYFAVYSNRLLCAVLLSILCQFIRFHRASFCLHSQTLNFFICVIEKCAFICAYQSSLHI